MIEIYFNAFRQAVIAQLEAQLVKNVDAGACLLIQAYIVERVCRRFDKLEAKRDTLALFAAMVKEESRKKES